MEASPAAISICAPYGMSPCIQHDMVSSMLAHLRLSKSNLSDIFFEIPPTVIIATVLLAVQISHMLTIVAIAIYAPRFPLT